MKKFGEDQKDRLVGKTMRVLPDYLDKLSALNWHKGVKKDYAGQTGTVLFVFHGSRPDHICLTMGDGEQVGFPFNALIKV